MPHDDAFVRERIMSTLRNAMDVAAEIAVCCPTPFVGTSAMHATRDLAELLRHLAWIPKEEALLMRGFDRAAMLRDLGWPITSVEMFREASHTATAFFEEAIAPFVLTDIFANAAGSERTVLDWYLEALSHAMHHRNQLYLSVVAAGGVVPNVLLERLFPGHLPVPIRV